MPDLRALIGRHQGVGGTSRLLLALAEAAGRPEYVALLESSTGELQHGIIEVAS